jgi:UDP-3-O-[3-hydroxymyristoyl] glucosamine N-acyltransferase
MKLSDIAKALRAELVGDGAIDIRRVVHPDDARDAGDLALALSKEARSATGGQRAGAVLLPADAPPPEDGRGVLLYKGNERVALAVLTALFDPGPQREAGIHATAVVAPDAALGAGVAVGPHAVVGRGAALGEGTSVMANAVIGAGAVVGRGCLIHPGAVIGERVRLGDRVIVHANAVVGADGFSFIPVRLPDGSPGAEGKPARIHSLGTVVVGDDVEIGAATTIDRATIRATRIGNGTKIDNQVQIGHNTIVGEACLICGQAGIAGSVTLGDRVIIAAGSGLSDHVRVGDDAVVMAMSGVPGVVPAGETYAGIPSVPLHVWRERYLYLGRLKALNQRVEALTARLAALEKSAKDG